MDALFQVLSGERKNKYLKSHTRLMILNYNSDDSSIGNIKALFTDVNSQIPLQRPSLFLLPTVIPNNSTRLSRIQMFIFR